MYDVIVIGAGPGGMTSAIFAVRAGLKTLILNDPQSLSLIEEAVEIDDWPGDTGISGTDLIKKMKEHVKKLKADYKDEQVLGVIKDGAFRVKTSKGEYDTKTVIFATGAKHRKVMVPGESEFAGKGVSYCASCDAPMFREKKVLVIGGGDTAITDALILRSVGADTTIVHRRDELRAAKSLEEQAKKAGVKFLWSTIIKEIKGDKTVTSTVLLDVKTQKTFEEKVDGIFVAIGTVPLSELANKIGVETDEAGFIKVDKEHRTNVPGVYAAGDCCDSPSKKIATAVGGGAMAAESAFQYLQEQK